VTQVQTVRKVTLVILALTAQTGRLVIQVLTAPKAIRVTQDQAGTMEIQEILDLMDLKARQAIQVLMALKAIRVIQDLQA
jgi:hypothetical protein